MVQQKECSISLVRLWAAPLNCITLEPGLGARCQGEGSCIRGAPDASVQPRSGYRHSLAVVTKGLLGGRLGKFLTFLGFLTPAHLPRMLDY